jgi:hypothetical protein
MATAERLSKEQRASLPRTPRPSWALERANEARRVYLAARELVERRSVVRGLIVLAVVAIVFSVARAGLGRAFVPGWWRQW